MTVTQSQVFRTNALSFASSSEMRRKQLPLYMKGKERPTVGGFGFPFFLAETSQLARLLLYDCTMPRASMMAERRRYDGNFGNELSKSYLGKGLFFV